MPLQTFLDELDQPVAPDLAKRVIAYMKGLPADQKDLVLKCAEYLDSNQTRRDILAVAYALNGGEILLKCRDDDALADDLTQEFDRLLDDKAL